MLPDHFPVFNIDLDQEFQSSDNKYPPYASKKAPFNTPSNKSVYYLQEQNFRLYTNTGKRKDNLDRGLWIRSDKMQLLALLDGHCDHEPINFLQKNLLKRLSDHPKIITQTEIAIYEVFQQLESQVIQSYQKGSTALVVIVLEKQIIAANLGDCKLYGITLEDRVTQLTFSHNLANNSELMQVISRGGIVLKKGTQYRINGQLNLSRSFGDRNLKYCMSSKPDIYRFQKKGFKRMIMTSDGFYNAKNTDERLLLRDFKQLLKDETTYLDNASAIFIDF